MVTVSKSQKLTTAERLKIKNTLDEQDNKRVFLAKFGLLQQQIDYPLAVGSCSVKLYKKLKKAFGL